MTNEEIKAQIEIMQKERDACSEEIKRCQSLCTHDKYELSNYSWRPGCIDIKKFCAYCGVILGDPDFEEGREFDKKQDFFVGKFMTDEEREALTPRIFKNGQ